MTLQKTLYFDIVGLSTTSSPKSDKVLEFKIDGITCTSCTGLIEAGLKSYVKEITVNVVTKQARMVVENDTDPLTIISAISNIDDKFKATRIVPQGLVGTNSHLSVTEKEYIDRIANVQMIEKALQAEKYVKEVSINALTKRARIVVDSNTDPQTIVRAISEVDKKFLAFWLSPKTEKTFYFSIEGMTSNQDASQISTALNAQKENVKSCEVNYSTNTATITTFAPDDIEKITEIANRFQSEIAKSITTHSIVVKRFLPRINDERNINKASQYYNRALTNGLVAVPLILLSGFIPLPLTIAGQLIGLFIGGVTFGVMWKTGKEFYSDAWSQLIKHGFRGSNMNTLIALGTGSAFVFSMLIVIAPALFPIAVLQYHFLAINMILGIINLGRGIRANAEEQTKSKVQKLAQVYVNLQPQTGRRLELAFKDKILNNENLDDDIKEYIKEIPYTDIKEGDIIQVHKGKRFPVEGIILSECGTVVDQETFTGESKHCAMAKGQEVYSGSLNLKNSVFIRSTVAGSKGNLTRLIADVDKSSASKPSISKLVDRLAVVFAPTILIISLITAISWFFLGPVPVLPLMFKNAMNVLLFACPCALGLATPISIAIAMFKLFHKKILVHDALILESAAKADTVVFDKTGTLTKPVVSDVYIGRNDRKWTRAEITQYIASLEKGFDHPIAKSFVTENSTQELLPCINAKKDEQGVSGKVNNVEVLVGNLSHLETAKIEVPEVFKIHESQFADKGMTSVYVAMDKKCVAVIGLKHEIRPDAKKTIEDLQARNIDVIMLTGDKREPAKAVAKELGILKVNWEHDSKMKKEFILSLKKKNRVVIMVGDGVNDAEALVVADVGIAVGSWTHASSVAKVATQNLNFVPMLIIAKEAMKNIHQNLCWTAFYNLLGLIAATGLLYPMFGFVLNPIIAGMSMALSSIFVVVNSTRLSYKVDYEVGVYENTIVLPNTLYQKIKQLFSFGGLIQSFKSAIMFNPQDTEIHNVDTPLSPMNVAANKPSAVLMTRRSLTPPSSPQKKPAPSIASAPFLLEDEVQYKSEPIASSAFQTRLSSM